MIQALRGVLAPVVTTFNPGGDTIAPAPFQANIRHHVDAGLSGIIVTGSTGEAALLDEAERLRLVELARVVVPDDRVLIAGVGAESTRTTIARASGAAELGAELMLVVPPHYFGRAMTHEALLTHYRAVADASPRPILLYNIPVFAHLTLEPELVAELAEHENIAGIKDSAGDLTRLRGYVAAQSDRFTVLTGHGPTLSEALELGARGAILAVSLYAAEFALSVFRAMQHQLISDATRAQQVLTPLAREIAGALGPAGIKAAMDVVGGGLHGGDVRPPLLPLDDVSRQRVAAMLRAAGMASVA